MNTGDSFASSCLRFIGFAVAALVAGGCTEQTGVVPTAAPAKKTMTEDAADLTLALGSLRQLAEGSDAQPAQRTIFYLNQWISSDPRASAPWQPDPMLDSVSRALRNTPGIERLEKLPVALQNVSGLERLSSLQFSSDSLTEQQVLLFLARLGAVSEDAVMFALTSGGVNFPSRDIENLRHAPWLDDLSFLQQNLWLHDIAQRARREPAPAYLQPWLKEIESSIGLPESEQLATAERMLDWTTRNIQLDPLPPTPKGPEAKAGSTETVLPASRGDVGPGYGHLPLEVLLYGHGDAHERARIFILLCRQVGIDAVMLGFQEERAATRRGWLPAALVGGKLYLFESGLGLPVPGPAGKGIATLDQVVKEPALLRQLDVEGAPPYAITEKDLKSGVFAMIDAEPAALSRRMQLLQAALPAAMRLALTTRPAELETGLRKANVSQIRLWDVPHEAILYRIGLAQRTRTDQQLAKDMYRLNVVFSPSRPLIKARNLHLQGRYENDDRKSGARSLYLQCRRPDREIEALLTNEFYRKTIGLEPSLPENPAQKQEQLGFITSIAREEKFDATFWLALTYSDVGKPGPAIEWLGKPVVEASPASPWTPAARYNLARCYEQLGQLDLARQWLLSDKDSPQRHGNLLRARMLGNRPQESK